ncbi:MAG: energy-coupled thiamine transporter ThiT [Candidatus Wallbacteria bacterium]|nr:energy-coupled thiamine transporter ThiT [Candidatus Wallbacteria bacterium]
MGSSVRKTRELIYISLTASLALVLGYLKIFELPQGGSISLEMLPLIWMSLLFGARFGVLTGLLLGLLNAYAGLSKGFVVHPVQLILDYPLAFGLVGLVGFFRDRSVAMKVLGITLVFAARYLSHVVSGVVFFSQYTPPGKAPLVYSLVYNSFLWFDYILTLLVWFLTFERIEKYFSEKTS